MADKSRRSGTTETSVVPSERREGRADERGAADERDRAASQRDNQADQRDSAASQRALAASALLDAEAFTTVAEAAQFASGVLEASTEYSIVAIDSGGRIVLWNEGAHRLYGYDRAEIVGESHKVLHTEEDVRGGLP